ncbi:hypothetical protein [Stenotrophomonas phage RAS14]
MNHVKLKRNKHLLIFQLNSDVPVEKAEEIAFRIRKELPEFKAIVNQSELTILTLEDEPPVVDIFDIEY